MSNFSFILGLPLFACKRTFRVKPCSDKYKGLAAAPSRLSLLPQRLSCPSAPTFRCEARPTDKLVGLHWHQDGTGPALTRFSGLPRFSGAGESYGPRRACGHLQFVMRPHPDSGHTTTPHGPLPSDRAFSSETDLAPARFVGVLFELPQANAIICEQEHEEIARVLRKNKRSRAWLPIGITPWNS